MQETKDTNPKDVIGSQKLSTSVVPDTLIAVAALAFTEGALKYGAYNWRESGVRMSVYLDALDRHRMKLRAGEWCDVYTRVPHLASMLACIGIILDAQVCGKLTVDLPPPVEGFSGFIDGMAETTKHLKSMFGKVESSGENLPPLYSPLPDPAVEGEFE